MVILWFIHYTFLCMDGWNLSRSIIIVCSLWLPTLYLVILFRIFFDVYPFDNNITSSADGISAETMKYLCILFGLNIIILLYRNAYKFIWDKSKFANIQISPNKFVYICTNFESIPEVKHMDNIKRYHLPSQSSFDSDENKMTVNHELQQEQEQKQSRSHSFNGRPVEQQQKNIMNGWMSSIAGKQQNCYYPTHSRSNSTSLRIENGIPSELHDANKNTNIYRFGFRVSDRKINGACIISPTASTSTLMSIPAAVPENMKMYVDNDEKSFSIEDENINMRSTASVKSVADEESGLPLNMEYSHPFDEESEIREYSIRM